MYNKELIERICANKCYKKELEDFCCGLEENKYDTKNSFEKYYSLESILNVLNLHRKGKISNRYFTSWMIAYLWIIQAECRKKGFYRQFKSSMPTKEIVKEHIINYIEGCTWHECEYHPEDELDSIDNDIKVFTELDELYHTIDEWEAFYAPDKEQTDEDYEEKWDYGEYWIIFVNHDKKKFVRTLSELDCREFKPEATLITKDQMIEMESQLQAADYYHTHNIDDGLDGLYGYGDSSEDYDNLPHVFNDEVKELYDRILNLTFTWNDLKKFDSLESDWEEKNGNIVNYTNPYDAEEPFKKYYDPNLVKGAIDRFINADIDLNCLTEWMNVYANILQEDTADAIFWAYNSRGKKKHLITKEAAIAYIIAEYIRDIHYDLFSDSRKERENPGRDLFTYDSIYQSINDWQVVYSPIEKSYDDDLYFHRVLFFNDRIKQFFITYPEISDQSICYYEGVCCDKYDFEKICDNLRSRKYKEILRANTDK